MDRTLEMVFENEEGKSSRLSVQDPREDIDASEVKEAMEAILEANIFDTNGGDMVKILGARIVSRAVEDLEVLA